MRWLPLTLLLVGCAAGNTGAKLSMSHINVGSIIPPPACPLEIRAPAEPAPILPDDAFFPAVEAGLPDSDKNAQAVANYFTFLRTYAAWAKEGWARADLARGFCSR